MKPKKTETEKKKIFPLNKERGLPLILTGAIMLVDQITKGIIAAKWPIPSELRYIKIADVFNNGFLQIIHVRNKAIAFSMGQGVPDFLKPILFIALPILVLGFVLWYYLKTDELTPMQRWAAAGIIGGGLGNIIDRIFRPDGVVDFIDVKFFGIFGWERWPTFNIADSSVVVCSIIVFITILFGRPKDGKQAAK